MARFQQFDCKNCGHPIDIERAGDLQKVTCPACGSTGIYDPADHRSTVIHYHQQPITTGTHPFPKGTQLKCRHGKSPHICLKCNPLKCNPPNDYGYRGDDWGCLDYAVTSGLVLGLLTLLILFVNYLAEGG